VTYLASEQLTGAVERIAFQPTIKRAKQAKTRQDKTRQDKAPSPRLKSTSTRAVERRDGTIDRLRLI
jgi:hypothetical protein